jgi:hypothetical protein
MKINDLVKVGDLVRYKHRHIGEQFVVVAVRTNRSSPKRLKVKCVSTQTLKETRWSWASTVSVLA